MSQLDPLLRDKVRNLGQVLGRTIAVDCGEKTFQLIEQIRNLSKQAHNGSDEDKAELIGLLKGLKDNELVPVARGFSQFLNLANIAEQQHSLSWRRQDGDNDPLDGMLDDVFDRILAQNERADLVNEVNKIDVELVLTAHPTEIIRRTLIKKYDEIVEILQILDDIRDDHPKRDRCHPGKRQISSRGTSRYFCDRGMDIYVGIHIGVPASCPHVTKALKIHYQLLLAIFLIITPTSLPQSGWSKPNLMVKKWLGILRAANPIIWPRLKITVRRRCQHP